MMVSSFETVISIIRNCQITLIMEIKKKEEKPMIFADVVSSKAVKAANFLLPDKYFSDDTNSL